MDVRLQSPVALINDLSYTPKEEPEQEKTIPYQFNNATQQDVDPMNEFKEIQEQLMHQQQVIAMQQQALREQMLQQQAPVIQPPQPVIAPAPEIAGGVRDYGPEFYYEQASSVMGGYSQETFPGQQQEVKVVRRQLTVAEMLILFLGATLAVASVQGIWGLVPKPSVNIEWRK